MLTHQTRILPGFLLPGMQQALITGSKKMTTPAMTLADLRNRAGHVKQSVIAASLQVQEPAISKLERKALRQTSLQKMAKYIDALGGKLAITITMPDGSEIALEDLCA